MPPGLALTGWGVWLEDLTWTACPLEAQEMPVLLGEGGGGLQVAREALVRGRGRGE